MHAGPGSLEEPRIDELTRGLRRLARGLVQGEADADDLVQDAWVAALRSPPDDPARLGGWLRRTLRNLAVDRRTAAARRQAHEHVVALPAESGDPDPGRIETLRTLLAEVEALDPPFRETIELRFLEGEPPRRIATRLGVPVATVHSRIQRGLARLRERLDERTGGDRKAWLAALAPWARPEGTLLGAGALAGLVVLMKTRVAALVAVCVLGGGGAAAWCLNPDEGIPGAGRETPPAQIAEPLEPLSDRAGRVAVDVDPDLDPAGSMAVARVRGRCLDESSGLPLAGVLATFEGLAANDELRARHADAPVWIAPDPVTTDADGRFEITFMPHPATQHGLELRLDGYAPRTGRWGPFAPGRVEDLGDVRMQQGFRVEALVLGEDGLPREGVEVSLGSLPLPLRTSLRANDTRGGRSGANGRLIVRSLLPAGTWPLTVSGTDRLVGPDAVTIPLAEPLIVTVADLRSLRGRVVDVHGLPLARLWVEGTTASGRGASGGWTDGDGRFVIRQTRGLDGPPVTISVHDRWMGRRIPATEVAVSAHWGQDDLQVQVERSGSLELRVVDDLSGEPIESYGVRLHPVGDRGRELADVRESGTHAEGRSEVCGLESGDNLLTVVPLDPHWHPSKPQTIRYVGQPIAEPVEVRLRRAARIDVRVLDGAGEPVEGARVELIDPGVGQPRALGLGTRVGAEVFTGREISETWRPRRLLSEQRTARNGLCTLLYDSEVQPELAIRATKDGFGGALRMVSAGSVEPVQIQLVPPSPVTGRFATDLSGYDQIRPQAWLVGGAPGTSSAGLCVDLAVDGSFVFSAVPAGSYDLQVRMFAQFRTVGGGLGRTLDPPSPVLEGLEVLEGQALDLGTIDLDLRAATVAGTITVGGVAPDTARLWFGNVEGSSWGGLLGEFAVADGGRFEVSGLPPGRWQPFVGVGFDGLTFANWSRGDAVLDLRPGERNEVEIRVARRIVRIRVVDRDERPLVDLPVSVKDWRGPSGSRGVWRRTDAEGWVVLDPAPDVPLVLQADPRHEVGASDAVHLQPAPVGEPVEVVLRVLER